MSLQDVPAAWLSNFAAAAEAGDVAAAVDNILPDGWLRDVLVFTWDTRSAVNVKSHGASRADSAHDICSRRP